MEFHGFYSLAWMMTVASGLMSGIYLTFSIIIMRSLALLESSQGINAMNAINQEIVKTGFMPLFFGSTIVALLMAIFGIWQWKEPGAGLAIAAGLIYAIGMFFVTAVFNVPLNNLLDQVIGDGQEATATWQHYLSVWTRWNTVRAIACAITMVICMALLTV